MWDEDAVRDQVRGFVARRLGAATKGQMRYARNACDSASTVTPTMARSCAGLAPALLITASDPR